MCVIVYQPPGKTVPKENLVEAAKCNRDGWGIAAIGAARDGSENKMMIVSRGMDMAKFADEAAKYAGMEAVFHCRIGTQGTKTLENCHPVKIRPAESNSVYMFHNGILRLSSFIDKDKNDTWHLGEMLKHYPKLDELLRQDAFLTGLGEMIGSSNKLVFITTAGVSIVNVTAGVWKEGIWYSNRNSFPVKYESTNNGYHCGTPRWSCRQEDLDAIGGKRTWEKGYHWDSRFGCYVPDDAKIAESAAKSGDGVKASVPEGPAGTRPVIPTHDGTGFWKEDPKTGKWDKHAWPDDPKDATEIPPGTASDGAVAGGSGSSVPAGTVATGSATSSEEGTDVRAKWEDDLVFSTRTLKDEERQAVIDYWLDSNMTISDLIADVTEYPYTSAQALHLLLRRYGVMLWAFKKHQLEAKQKALTEGKAKDAGGT